MIAGILFFLSLCLLGFSILIMNDKLNQLTTLVNDNAQLVDTAMKQLSALNPALDALIAQVTVTNDELKANLNPPTPPTT